MADISPRPVRVLPRRSTPPADGFTAAARRASDVGVGIVSLSTSGIRAVFDRFLPATGYPADPSAVRQVARAATGVALVTEQQMLALSGRIERLTERALDRARGLPVVRDVLVGIDSSMTRWVERGDAELERRQAVVTGLVARLVPAMLDEMLERIDFAAVAARIPVAQIIDAIDVDAMLATIDVDALVQRVDADALVQRVDVEALIQRVDVEAMLHRVDLGPIVAEVLTEVDVGGIVRESTDSITTDAVDSARLTAMRLDGFVARIADRVLLRGTTERANTTAVTETAEDAEAP